MDIYIFNLRADDSIEDLHGVGRSTIRKNLRQDNGLVGVDIKRVDLDGFL